MRLFRLESNDTEQLNRQFDRVAQTLTGLEVATNALQSRLARLAAVAQVSSGGGSSPVVPADIDDAIRARVMSLTSLRQFSYWSDPFINKPGRPGSLWTDLHPTDAHMTSDFQGGTTIMFAQAGYGGAFVDGEGNYPFASTYRASFLTDINISDWYVGVRFMLMPDPGGGAPGGWTNGDNAFLIGFVDATTLKVAGVGIALNKGAFFGAVCGNVNGLGNTFGADSLTAKDFSVWHYAELYRTGGKVWVNLDNGTPVDVSSTLTSTDLPSIGTPLIELCTVGTRQPAITVDHYAIAAPRNGSLI